MRLELDVGNTRAKWRLCDSSSVAQRGAVERCKVFDLVRAFEASQTPRQVWVSSVAGEDLQEEFSSACSKAWGVRPWFARTRAQALGLNNSYAEPQRMGVDRWLAMLAAWNVTRGSCCVVDAGSALTIDFISGAGDHLGGYIIPGLDSMERALLSDTDRVRFGNAARNQLDPGRSTEEAVYNGILISQAGAVSLALQRVDGDPVLWFSGGNGQSLRDLIGQGGGFEEDLVLNGLRIQAELELGEAESAT